MTVLALRGYGVGLLGLIGVKVLAPGFFAQQDLRTPVRIAVVVLACTQLMNLVFVPWLGHAGLALSIGLGAMVNASWLLYGLRARGCTGLRRAGRCSCCVCCRPTWGWGCGWAGPRRPSTGWPGAATPCCGRGLGGAIAVGAVIYFGLLWLVGLRPRTFLRRA
jgi:putative peptidoglycan lipid II flippase